MSQVQAHANCVHGSPRAVSANLCSTVAEHAVSLFLLETLRLHNMRSQGVGVVLRIIYTGRANNSYSSSDSGSALDLLQPHAAQLPLITSDVRSRIHETYLALQFSIDLTPLPPDHLGEPDTPYAICTFSFRLDHSLLHCVLLIPNAQIPIAEPLELCTQFSAAFH